MSPEWWRAYRAKNRAKIRERERERHRRQRAARGRGDRSAEYAKRPSRAIPKITPLYPELQRGGVLSFRDDELRMDLAQERALAEFEGRDPDEAVRMYQAREAAWWAVTESLFPE
jgi:hypothetical protein